LRLAGARSSPDRVEIAYTMLGDDPDAGHIYRTCSTAMPGVTGAKTEAATAEEDKGSSEE
jgi:hypothetical protein